MGGVSERGCQKGLIGFGLLLDDFWEGLKKQGSSLDWMLLESGGDSMIEDFNNSYLEGGKT